MVFSAYCGFVDFLYPGTGGREMKNQLEKQLLEMYPKIFKNLYDENSCMKYGIECGDGWYDLIETLCHSLQWYADKNGYPQVIADQIKEKFGGLRFYIHYDEPYDPMVEKYRYLEGMIHFAEQMSFQICEKCGEKGKTINTGCWSSTSCEKCLEI